MAPPRITRARPPRRKKPKPVAVVVKIELPPSYKMAKKLLPRTPAIVTARSPAEIAKAKRIQKLRERGY